MMITDEDLKRFQSIKEEVNKKKKIYTNLTTPDKEYAKAIMFLNPQSYGSLCEKRLLNQLGAEKISAKANSGDLRFEDLNLEVKCSLLDRNEVLNMVQVRPWQEIDAYLCVAYDVRNVEEYRTFYYVLTKKQMSEELLLLKATAAHGTAEANEKNKNVEKAIRLNMMDEDLHFQRWQERYSCKDIEEVKSVLRQSRA